MSSGNCTICGCYSATIHYHHCIPQAYGGVDGPVVPLCGNCHTILHANANAVLASVKTNSRKMFWQTPEQLEKATPLVKLIVESARKTVVNKTFKMTVEMDSETYSMLKFLKKDFGTASLEDALKHCVKKTFSTVINVTENTNEKKRISLW